MRSDTEQLFRVGRNVLITSLLLILTWVVGIILGLWDDIPYRFLILILGLFLLREGAQTYLYKKTKLTLPILLLLALILIISSLTIIFFVR